MLLDLMAGLHVNGCLVAWQRQWLIFIMLDVDGWLCFYCISV